MRRGPLIIVLSVALAALPAISHALDGDRQGFVVGGGLGVAPLARWSADLDHERMAALGMNFVAGYAWNEQDLVAYELNVAIYSSHRFNSAGLFESGSWFTTQGFQGAAWYHYLGPSARPVFTAIGLGLGVFNRGEYYHSAPRPAFLLGCGYAFARHWQVGCYFSGGSVSDAGRDFALRHLNLLVSGLAF